MLLSAEQKRDILYNNVARFLRLTPGDKRVTLSNCGRTAGNR